MSFNQITDRFLDELQKIHFESPADHVYNPLMYARKPYDQYLSNYGSGTKEIVLLGMNPGPWGMVQNGIPFGEITAVTEWLGINAPIEQRIPNMHPKRPILGYACTRHEISGKRLWGWVKQRFKTPKTFFKQFFVINYCPLAFFNSQGQNITPEKLKKTNRESVYSACNGALNQYIDILNPKYVIGIGTFAEARIREVLGNKKGITIAKITHPSPANPKANKGWVNVIEKEFLELGISFD